ncbi:MAG: AAA family ATPase [Beijerinckiaceae bacterium]|nr:AAA family ATPase [Beijerinckiaceae bacterium]
MGEEAGELAFDEFRLDPANALLWRGGARVALPPKPFELLCCLAKHAGQLVTKDELLSAVWSNLHVSESSLSVSINALRIALGDNAKAPRYIETVTRRGYRFIATVITAPQRNTGQLPGALTPVPQSIAQAQPRWRVGRTAPLETLETIVDEASAGNRRMVFVTGEAGIGKTTLLEMLTERICRRGIGVLLGRCVEHFGTDEAFLPFIDALQERCGGPDGPNLIKALRSHAPAWLAQMPGLLKAEDRAALQGELFGATRERMVREFCELIEALSAERPWIIIIEDLHWSDYATLDVLSRLGRREQTAPVLVIATYRPGDAMAEGHPARTVHQELQIHGLCTEIALGTLSFAEVEQYLALRFNNASMVDELARRVFRRTRGQPLFVVSLVDYAVTQGEVLQAGGHWQVAPEEHVASEGMPRDLKEMIARQIDRLEAGEQSLLEAASAAGAEFSAALVAGALDREIQEIEQLCEGLARKGQILMPAGTSEWPDSTVAGRYAFSHALYQELFYHRLAPGQRVHLHRRLGKRLEAAYGPRTQEAAAVLALHFEEGREFMKAVRYLGQAAENSAKRFGNREATIYLSRAINLVRLLPAGDQVAVRLRLLQHRGRVRRSAGELRGALEDLSTVVSCAAEANDLLTEVKALLDLSRFYVWGDRKQCLELAERALARSRCLNDEVVTALAHGNWASLRLYLRGWQDEDADLCRKAVKLISETNDPRIATRRCGIKSTLELTTSNYRDCSDAADSCQESARERGDVYSYVIFNTFSAFSLLQLGAWREMRQRLSAALAMTEKNANRQVSCLPNLMSAWLHLEAQDFRGARQRCEAALDPEVEENPVNFFLGRNLLARASLGLGDYQSAHKQLAEITYRIEAGGVIMETVFYPLFYHNFCDYALAVGDLAKAREEAIRLYNAAKLPPERTYLALAHRLFAKIAIAEGNIEEARNQLSRAISIVEHTELPLAAWRVYAAAAEFHERLGELKRAGKYRGLCQKVIGKLAGSFDSDDPLRLFLSAAFECKALASSAA